MDNRPIGIFDSGVGGLTVAKQVIKVLGNENIVYFGDTARLPYGSKSKETVTRFSKQIVRFLLTKDVKSVIIACNTASANSLEELQKTFDIPIFGVVVPGASEAVKATKNKKVGIIGTVGTVRTNAYKKLICDYDSNIEVFSKACPLFVPLVEEDWTNNEITRLTAEKYLKELLDEGIDSLVLGCTHYPLLKQCIGDVVGENVKLVDPAKETALTVKKFLTENNMLNDSKEENHHIFYVSDYTEQFDVLCKKALKKVYKPHVINIESY